MGVLGEPIRPFKNEKCEHFWREWRNGVGGGIYTTFHFFTLTIMLPFLSETVGNLKQRHTTGEKT